jgi:mediator of DNA damage checkpoint protein 1
MAVFDGVRYSLSPSLSPTRRTELANVLDLNGAAPLPPYTHLITLPASHAVHNNEATKLVTDRWVDRSVVMGKLQSCVSLLSPVYSDRHSHSEQYYSPDPAMIFSSVVACATDVRLSHLLAHHLTLGPAFCRRLGGPLRRYHRPWWSVAHRSHPRRHPSLCPPCWQ